MNVRVFRPRSVHARIAAGCNLGCVFCERENLPESSPGSGRKKRGTLTFSDGRAPLPIEKDMTIETWALVKSKFMPHVQNMELGGLGEPTLGKIFVQAAGDIVNAGKNLFFFTNGHFLNLPRVLECVGETPHISVSIDAGTPEAYKRIRKGELGKLVESVKGFRAAKPGAVIDSQFTAIADNIDEIPRWVELCAELGIGRFDNGERLLLNGADHHTTNRVEQSVRFHRDRTMAALAEGVRIAQANGLWLESRLPKFSDENPNAGTDGSDPRGIRRWADVMFFGENPCGGGTGDLTGTTETATGPSLENTTAIAADPGVAMPNPFALAEGGKVVPTEVAKEVYVDYDGKVWSCLARHQIGDINSGDWNSIIDQNTSYQEFLANWHYGNSMENHDCKSCPRRK